MPDDISRVPRLEDWRRLPNGSVPAARCRDCGHLAPLSPSALLLRNPGSLALERLRSRLSCGTCGGRSVDLRTMRLCDPGCPRQRG